MNKNGLAEIEWAVETARSGVPTLQVGGHYVHSSYDPRRESVEVVNWVAREIRESEADLVIGLGTGLGYIYEELLERVSIPLLLWEPFPHLIDDLPLDSGFLHDFESLQKSGSFSNWQGRVTRVVTPESYDSALAELLRPGMRPYFFVHPGYDQTARFEARYLAYGVRCRRGAQNLSVSESIPSPRSIEVLSRYPFLHTIDELAGSFDGQTAVLVSAGPSVKLAVSTLAKRTGGVVMAALQAARPLAEAGVESDFAVICDPRDYSGFIEGLATPFSALLADSMVEPAMLDRAPERTFLFHLRSPHVFERAWSAEGLPIIEHPASTVAEVSLLLAHEFGARRIVLVGVDLDSSDPRYTYQFRVPGADGLPAVTNSVYFHAARFLSWLCPKLAANGCEIGRVGSGLPIRGTRRISVDEMSDWLSNSPRFKARPPEAAFCSRRWKRADALLQELGRPADCVPPIVKGDGKIRGHRPLSGAELRQHCAAARSYLAEEAPG